ncbi:MAG: beta-ketoacyl-[acyl-carrier-protein] synthase II, partial [Phycisphaerae bacterium]
AAVRALQRSVVPPTVNLETPDDRCDLDYCAKNARDRKVRIALSSSFGFGGHNACILIRRIE